MSLLILWRRAKNGENEKKKRFYSCYSEHNNIIVERTTNSWWYCLMRNNRQSWAALFWPSCFESGRPMMADDWFRRGDTDDERCVVTGLGGVEPAAATALPWDDDDDPLPPRWNSDGARHTAKLLADIWFTALLADTRDKKSSNVSSASRCSSGNRSTVQWTASFCKYTGTSIIDIKKKKKIPLIAIQITQ